jgi:hypothetical protein
MVKFAFQGMHYFLGRVYPALSEATPLPLSTFLRTGAVPPWELQSTLWWLRRCHCHWEPYLTTIQIMSLLFTIRSHSRDKILGISQETGLYKAHDFRSGFGKRCSKNLFIAFPCDTISSYLNSYLSSLIDSIKLRQITHTLSTSDPKEKEDNLSRIQIQGIYLA